MSNGPQLVKELTLANGLPLKWVKFPNGLNLMVVENRDDPSFVYQTWFRVGALAEKMDERLKRTGLAHLFEHMMFRGTQRFPDGVFDRMLTRTGGHNNATTWNDRTNYYEVMSRGNLEQVMDLEADRFQNLVVDHKLLETEKGAVLGEYRMGRDNPDVVAYDHLYSTAFQVHPYRCTVIGSEEDIQSFSVEDANYFYSKYYHPEGTTLLICGDVDTAETIALAEKYYAGIKKGGVPKKVAPPVEPPQSTERRAEFQHGQITEPKALVSFHTPGVNHPDMPALLLLASLLSNGRGSRLHYEWINKKTWVNSVSAHVDQFEYPGLFTIDFELNPDNDVETVLEDSDRLLHQPFTELELERGRNQLLLDVYQGWEDQAEVCSFLGEYLVSAGDPLYGFEMLEKIRQLKLTDIHKVVGTYFSKQTRTIVIGRAL